MGSREWSEGIRNGKHLLLPTSYCLLPKDSMKRTILAFLFIGSIIAGAYLFFYKPLPDHMERRKTTYNDRHVTFTLLNLSEAGLSFSLANAPEDVQSVSFWRKETGADFTVNGAYFNDAYEPTGFYARPGEESIVPWPSLEAQKEAASYSFLVEVKNGGLGLSYLPESPKETAPTEGFLSFPTLIAGGEMLVTNDTGLQAERSVLAEAENGDTYLIIVEKGSVSLFEAASWLMEQPEHFVIAGNLDGGPSTGLSYTDGKRIFDELSAPIPNVILGNRE